MIIHKYDNDIPNDFILEGDIAIDTEATGVNTSRDRLCLLQFSNGNGEAHLVKFHKQNYEAINLKKFLIQQGSVKIFHYARFDVGMIYKYLGIEIDNIYCTKIASRLVRTYTDSHSLKELCRELLNINISKQQQCSDWASEILSHEQLQYAASDVIHLHELRILLNQMLLRENRKELAQECFNAILIRAKLDVLGWAESDIFSYR